jgi:NAD(P)-dependent dehydrogenase (short-subunit alcohol dehydrogenase family)
MVGASVGGLQARGGVMTSSASKAAVIHFSKCVATELASQTVSVNCIADNALH